jgi:hypothetical protein
MISFVRNSHVTVVISVSHELMLYHVHGTSLGPAAVSGSPWTLKEGPLRGIDPSLPPLSELTTWLEGWDTCLSPSQLSVNTLRQRLHRKHFWAALWNTSPLSAASGSAGKLDTREGLEACRVVRC